MGTVCDALGGRAILDEISRILDVRVGETSDDGRWMLERLPCFGTCARAPMMQINDQAYTNLTLDSVRSIFTSKALPPGDRAPIAGDGRPAPSREEIEA
jgi:NADH:ubiquinone oxidoreductase subunit E